jgi:hypothetical protein
MITDKRCYLDKIIFSAKMGNKESFERIRSMYRYICDKIFQTFSKIYQFIKYKWFDVYQMWYVTFMRTINKHKFDEDSLFSYELYNSLIDDVYGLLKNQYNFNEKLLISKEVIEKSIKKEGVMENRKKMLTCFKIFTPRQMEAVSALFFGNRTYKKAIEFLEIPETNFETRVSGAYFRIKRTLKKVKTGKKRVKHRERVYRVLEIKID